MASLSDRMTQRGPVSLDEVLIFPVDDLHEVIHNPYHPWSLQAEANPLRPSLSDVNQSPQLAAAPMKSSITKTFLDQCLQLFLTQFLPTFPILHHRTFAYNQTIQPLRLIAVAIGSMYLEGTDALAMGEILWHLGRMAITTSWGTFVNLSGPDDPCNGVQLVISAMLGQICGTLSRNRQIRDKSQGLHSLGFTWAHHCNLFESEDHDLENLPSVDDPQEQLEAQWYKWIAIEIRQRALLSIFLVDGLAAQMSGKHTSILHSANELSVVRNEAAFRAPSAHHWLTEMQNWLHTQQVSFRNVISSLFTPGGPTSITQHLHSPFTTGVLLEAFHSLVQETTTDQHGERANLGFPDNVQVKMALSRLAADIANSQHLSYQEKDEAILRWHEICLQLELNHVQLFKHICLEYNLLHHHHHHHHDVFPAARETADFINLAVWVPSPSARRALLHVARIQEIFSSMPRARASAIHIPSCLSAAATVYMAFALAGATFISLPTMVKWQDVLCSDAEIVADTTDLALPTARPRSETLDYINGRMESVGLQRHVMLELSEVLELLCLGNQWGDVHGITAAVKDCRELYKLFVEGRY